MRATFRTLRAACGLVVALATGACTTVVRVSDVASPSLAEAQSGYARVLSKHVNTRGEVDFSALRDDTSDSGLPALKGYVRAIGLKQSFPTAPATLTHWINAYNALSMYNVVASGIPVSHNGFAKVRFFVLRKFEIDGQTLSLYAFENDVIRPLNEPRVHFALNCSAVSCPVLPRVPFTASNLDAELERETRVFFSKSDNLHIDHTQRTVTLNAILSFYTEDFSPAHAPTLIAYVSRYAAQPIPPDYTVVFAPYDWTIANSKR